MPGEPDMLAGMKHSEIRRIVDYITTMLMVVISCVSGRGVEASAERSGETARITTDNLLHHIQVLSSDEFEGRAPGTRSETLTVDYITRQFREMGLKPGNPDGSFVQKVPLVGFRAQPSVRFTASN